MTIKELLAGLETESNEKLKVVVFNVEDGEIAVYTRSDIDLEEYRGWESLRVAFWGVNADRVIIHTAVRERQPIQVEKRRMTCREWLIKHFPDEVTKEYGGLLNDEIKGGCVGCPYEHFDEAKCLCLGHERESSPEFCTACWSQPVPEGVEG